jgi:preprotein translocase subunit SecE
MTQLINYFKATMRELKQVSWPTRKQSIIYTILVIAISAIVALYVGAFDYVFSQIISSLISII